MGEQMQAYRNYLNILKYTEDSIVIKEYRPDGKGGFEGGEITCASLVKARHYNHTMQSILGLTDFDLMSPEEAQESLQTDLWVMINKRSLKNISEKHTYPNGETVIKSATKSPIFLSNDMVGGVLCITRYIEIISPI